MHAKRRSDIDDFRLRLGTVLLPLFVLALGALFLLGGFVLWAQGSIADLPAITGETNAFSQVRALGQLAMNLTRPPLDLRPDAVRGWSLW